MPAPFVVVSGPRSSGAKTFVQKIRKWLEGNRTVKIIHAEAGAVAAALAKAAELAAAAAAAQAARFAAAAAAARTLVVVYAQTATTGIAESGALWLYFGARKYATPPGAIHIYSNMLDWVAEPLVTTLIDRAVYGFARASGDDLRRWALDNLSDIVRTLGGDERELVVEMAAEIILGSVPE